MSVAEVAIRVGQLEEEEDIFWMGTHSYTPCPHAGLVTGHQSHPAPPFKQSRKVELVSPPAAAAGRGGAGKVWGQHSSLPWLGPGCTMYLLQGSVQCGPHYNVTTAQPFPGCSLPTLARLALDC